MNGNAANYGRGVSIAKGLIVGDYSDTFLRFRGE